MSIEIPLGGRRGGVALVDPEDAHLAELRWYLDANGYVQRSVTIAPYKTRQVKMHRVILGLEFGDARQSDHRNGNRTDNRRSNLRIVTHAQNTQNVRQKIGRSGHRNVYLHNSTGLWRVQVRADGQLFSGGYFHTIEDAAKRAKALRRELLPFSEDA